MAASNDTCAIVFTDDGIFPNNSRVALTLYPGVFGRSPDADDLSARIRKFGWEAAWRYGVYPYHHYHSTAHEFLGCFVGSARILFGGDRGQVVEIRCGDGVMVPAGVAHKCLSSTRFAVVGAYPEGQSPDMNYGEASERPKADLAIQALGLPAMDPVTGAQWPDFPGVIF